MAGRIHHSDRGSQHCPIDYQGELRKRGFTISMGGRGNCCDKAIVETFFKTQKAECVRRAPFQTRKPAQIAIARYIDGFYNPARRHPAIGCASTIRFEMAAQKRAISSRPNRGKAKLGGQ